MLFYTGRVWLREGFNGCQSDLASESVYSNVNTSVQYHTNQMELDQERSLI